MIARSSRLRVAAPVGLLAGGVLVWQATYAALTATTDNAGNSFSADTVALADISTAAPNNRMSVGASNLLPGDAVQRAVTLRNTGTGPMSSAALSTDANPSSALDTDATNGLQMRITRCSVAWTETGGPAYTYTCGGTTSTVLASRPVIGTAVPLDNLTLTPDTDNYLVVVLTLPSSAPDSTQNATSTIGLTFTGAA